MSCIIVSEGEKEGESEAAEPLNLYLKRVNVVGEWGGGEERTGTNSQNAIAG